MRQTERAGERERVVDYKLRPVESPPSNHTRIPFVQITLESPPSNHTRIQSVQSHSNPLRPITLESNPSDHTRIPSVQSPLAARPRYAPALSRETPRREHPSAASGRKNPPPSLCLPIISSSSQSESRSSPPGCNQHGTQGSKITQPALPCHRTQQDTHQRR